MTRPALVALVVGVLLACSGGADTNNFREDVMYCEEALATLTSCCPGFDPGVVACQYYYESTSNACGLTTERYDYPALSQPESQCILSTKCSDLVASGVCKRAQGATEYTGDKSDPQDTCCGRVYGTDTSSSHPPVCP